MPVHDPRNPRLEECRVYEVAYTVFGRQDRILTIVRACVIAMDVADLVDQIRKTCLGVELTWIGPNGVFCQVAERVEIESAQLVGRLHGITDTAYQIIASCDAAEKDSSLDES